MCLERSMRVRNSRICEKKSLKILRHPKSRKLLRASVSGSLLEIAGIHQSALIVDTVK